MSKSITYPLIIIGILFFVFGFITWANGVLIPYFRVGLELNNFQSTWVVFSAYLAYFVMAIPSAWILKRTGYKKGMFIGLLVMATGTFLFVPAAYIRAYWLFLTGLFVTGTGLALLQTAANPYVAVIGPIESTAKRIGFMGLANKIAGLVSLAALGSLFLSNADNVLSQVAQADATQKTAILGRYILDVVNPYLVITAILVLLAAMIRFSNLPEVNESASSESPGDTGAKRSVFQFPNLVFGVVALFFSAACEVIPIDGIILYSSALGIPISESRFFAQYTLIAMTLGYVASILLIPRYLSQQGALLGCTIWGGMMTIGAYATQGVASVCFVIAMGFSSAMLWGTIWGLALKGLGRFTKIGSALLLMSVVGGGVFPVIFGRLLDVNLALPQNAILMLVPCNLVMMWYALRQSRPRTGQTSFVKALVVDYAHALGERVRPNRWTACLLLARLYSYQQQWEAAKRAADEVIAQTDLYELEDDLGLVYLKNSRESIWQLMAVSIDGTNTFEGLLAIPGESQQQPPRYSVAAEVLATAEPEDARLHNWLGFYTMPSGDGPYNYPFKYKVRVSETGSAPSEYSTVLRLAEAYLIRAEANLALGNVFEALSDVNATRVRHGGLDTLETQDGDVIRNAIERERQLEFFYEWGHRWSDLKRWGRNDVSLPIPQRELEANPYLTQNPDY